MTCFKPYGFRWMSCSDSASYSQYEWEWRNLVAKIKWHFWNKDKLFVEWQEEVLGKVTAGQTKIADFCF